MIYNRVVKAPEKNAPQKLNYWDGKEEKAHASFVNDGTEEWIVDIGKMLKLRKEPIGAAVDEGKDEIPGTLENLGKEPIGIAVDEEKDEIPDVMKPGNRSLSPHEEGQSKSGGSDLLADGNIAATETGAEVATAAMRWQKVQEVVTTKKAISREAFLENLKKRGSLRGGLGGRGGRGGLGPRGSRSMPPSSLPQQGPHHHADIGEVSDAIIKEGEAHDVVEMATLLAEDSGTGHDAGATFEMQLEDVLANASVVSKKTTTRDSFVRRFAERGTFRGGRGGRGGRGPRGGRSMPPLGSHHHADIGEVSDVISKEGEAQDVLEMATLLAEDNEARDAVIRESEEPGKVVDTVEARASESDISGGEAGTRATAAEVRWDNIRKGLPAVLKKTVHRDEFIAKLASASSASKKTIHRDAFISLLMAQKKPAKRALSKPEEPRIGGNADGSTTDLRSEETSSSTAASSDRVPSSPIRTGNISSELPESRVDMVLKRKEISEAALGDDATPPAVELAMAMASSKLTAGVAETKGDDKGTGDTAKDINSTPSTPQVIDASLGSTTEI